MQRAAQPVPASWLEASAGDCPTERTLRHLSVVTRLQMTPCPSSHVSFSRHTNFTSAPHLKGKAQKELELALQQLSSWAGPGAHQLSHLGGRAATSRLPGCARVGSRRATGVGCKRPGGVKHLPLTPLTNSKAGGHQGGGSHSPMHSSDVGHCSALLTPTRTLSDRWLGLEK